ncbi:MAG: tRNA lysidine(34) synthetase TilS [Clostridiales bacterium]|nr:tRNA lysidine(34) synthetase TilS [Clostridiales bacterium]
MKNLDLTKKYALAVSGGVDSMTMLHMFATSNPRPNFFVVTVNHCIRAEAESDCKFVADYCAKLNVECRIISVDVPVYCEQNKLSVETGARILRYQALDSLESDFVCLAHNANDNAETVLMHILRGSGAKGATGIKRLSGKYLRPILDLTREQIEQYAKENNVSFVQDVTNDDTKYTRNYIRHKVLPVLTELNPQVQRNILRFATNMQSDDEYLDELADISAVQFESNVARIPIELLIQHTSIAYRVLNKVFNGLCVYYDIEKTHFDAIVDIAKNNGGKRVNLPFNYVAINDYGYVTICLNGSETTKSECIPFKIGTTETPLGVVEVSEQPMEGSLRLDVSHIPDTAVFRTRMQGDKFTKFGGGTKLLKDYLIDKKIPQRMRDKLLLVANGSDVLVICGVEIADSVKVTANSHNYYIKLHQRKK